MEEVIERANKTQYGLAAGQFWLRIFIEIGSEAFPLPGINIKCFFIMLTRQKKSIERYIFQLVFAFLDLLSLMF